VFGALNLSTACNCVAKALVRAVFGAEGIRAEGYTRFLYYKERQLRRFRARMTSRRPFGKALERQIRKDVAAVGQILAEDEEAFGLLVEALRPLVRQPTNYGILRTEVDGELAGALEKFGSYVARRSKKLAPTVRVGKEILKSIEGRSIGDVLRADDLSFKPKKRPPKEEKSEG